MSVGDFFQHVPKKGIEKSKIEEGESSEVCKERDRIETSETRHLFILYSFLDQNETIRFLSLTFEGSLYR